MNHARSSLLRALSAAALLVLISPLGAQSTPASAPPPITVTDLDTLGGTLGTTQVTAMNDLGMIVGVGPKYRAFAWTVTDGFMDIGTLPGGNYSAAVAVNNAGQVVGFGSDASGYYYHAFIWTKAGGLVDLGAGPNGYSAFARAINASGEVAGDFASYGPPEGKRAFYWSSSTGMKDLGSLGGQSLTVSGINSNGVLVGTAGTPAGHTRAFSSRAKGGPLKDLGTLGGSSQYQSSSATGINDDGVVTGDSQAPDGNWHAFVHSRNQMTDIHTFGWYSHAAAINANGMVVGESYLGGGSRAAFVYTTGGGMIDIGSLGGGECRATAVNNNGVVTGVSGTRSFRDHPFRWSAAAGMQDAGDPDDRSSQGVAINASGQIAGMFVNNNNDSKGFILDPTNGRTNIQDQGRGDSTAVAINSSGQVAGQSLNRAGYTRAFNWTASGGMFEIYTPAGHHSSVVGMNDAGQVIGHHGLTKDSYTQGFLWSTSAGWQEITAGGYHTTLIAINAPGLVVGYGINAAYQGIAFLRQVDGTLLTIPPPAGGTNVQPVAMNDSGVIIGTFQQNYASHAFQWSPTTGSIDLGDITAVAINKNGDFTGRKLFGTDYHAYLKKVSGPYKDLGTFAGSNYSEAVAINSNAHVVGYAGNQGFYYDAKMKGMGTLGGVLSIPTALNDLGQAVGWSYTATGESHAFLWTKADGIRALTTLGGQTSRPSAINVSGQVVGESLLPDSSKHAVLWTTR